MQTQTQKSAKEQQQEYYGFVFDKIVKKVLSYGLLLIVINLAMVIVDAFLIKGGAAFTFIGLLRWILYYIELGIYYAGYYIGKGINFLQLFWDILNAVWEFLLPYLPINEVMIARANLLKLFDALGVFVLGGFLKDLLDGFTASINLSTALALSLMMLGVMTLLYVSVYGDKKFFGDEEDDNDNKNKNKKE